VREHLKLTPGELRRRRSAPSTRGGLAMELQYRPPYDWAGVLAFFRRHAVEGVESADGTAYRRRLPEEDGGGEIVVRQATDRHALRLELTEMSPDRLMPLVARVRRMFDLDANPVEICEVIGGDAQLAPLLAQWPGIRAPGHWSPYEASVRAIVGQQVSTEAARGICGRLAIACAGFEERPTFPCPAALAGLDDNHFPMPGRRRDALRALAAACIDRDRQLDAQTLGQSPGVGPWTLAMVGMRGFGDPDAFPLTDLGVVKAWQALAPDEALESRMARWRPWRAYAANLLWRSLSP
jgi:AraC family transcriptional regulator of adaptative response / DNA-3-methyladenine glycosylase II